MATRKPDLVALQEITGRSLPLWSRAFKLMGLQHVRVSSISQPAIGEPASRRTRVMVGSRIALSEAEQPLELPRPESVVSVLAQAASGPLELHCVHVPNAANGWVKVETLQMLRRGLAAPARVARVLGGDLNTPRRELANGETISFARDSRGRLRAERGPQWDAAELGVVPGLRDLGYRDAYRALHGYGSRSPSWTWKKIAGHDSGWRLDHIFLSRELRPVACQYHHEWRDDGLSDHSALEADVEFSPHSEGPADGARGGV